jgi:hypothetical protein
MTRVRIQQIQVCQIGHGTVLSTSLTGCVVARLQMMILFRRDNLVGARLRSSGHRANASMSACVTDRPSSNRSRFSSKTFSENGRREIPESPFFGDVRVSVPTLFYK